MTGDINIKYGNNLNNIYKLSDNVKFDTNSGGKIKKHYEKLTKKLKNKKKIKKNSAFQS